MNKNLKPKDQGMGELFNAFSVLSSINDDPAYKKRFDEITQKIARLEELTVGYKNVKEIELATAKAHELRAEAERDRKLAEGELHNAKQMVEVMAQDSRDNAEEQANRLKHELEATHRDREQTEAILKELNQRQKDFETQTISIEAKLEERERACSNKETRLIEEVAHWVDVGQKITALVKK